jgi:hypothetical protein
MQSNLKKMVSNLQNSQKYKKVFLKSSILTEKLIKLMREKNKEIKRQIDIYHDVRLLK